MRHLQAFTLFLLLQVLISAPVLAQDGSQNPAGGWQVGLSLRSGFSFSGVNLGLCLDMKNEQVRFFVGPKVSLTRSYRPLSGPWGIIAGGDYVLNPAAELQSMLHAQYQATFFSGGGGGIDAIHEAFLGYGARYNLAPQFFIGADAAIGFYIQSNYVETTAVRRRFAGYNGLLQLNVGYEFN